MSPVVWAGKRLKSAVRMVKDTLYRQRRRRDVSGKMTRAGSGFASRDGSIAWAARSVVGINLTPPDGSGPGSFESILEAINLLAGLS